MFQTKIERIRPLTGFDRRPDQIAQVSEANRFPCSHAIPFSRTAGSRFSR